MMKRLISLVAALALLLTLTPLSAGAEEAAPADAVVIYVSPDGDDAAAGTEDAPLATLDAALEAARAVRRESNAPLEIFMRGGEYFVDHAITVDASLSGTEDAPFAIRAYGDENVCLVGGVKVDKSRMRKVTDGGILSRIIDKEAAERLYEIDLEGIVGELDAFYGGGESIQSGDVQVYLGEERLQYARWPNNQMGSAYLYTHDAVMLEDGTYQFTYEDDVDRAARYWSEESKENLWIRGFLAYEWSNDPNAVLDMDYAAKAVHTSGRMDYDPTPGAHRFFFFNVLEEIDLPGESYLDRASKKIYCYPADAQEENIYVALTNAPLLHLNGVSHMVLEGIDLKYTRATALTASGVSHVRIAHCDIAHTSLKCCDLRGEHILVDGCSFYDTFLGGMDITGGDRKTLTSGESVVRNCRFFDLCQGVGTYGWALQANSVGMKIQNNLFSDFVHGVMRINTNDVIVEYNEFCRCVTDSGDMGALYFGRDPSLLGIVIRYNYFHDIGGPYDPAGNGQQAIFMDDGSIGAHIYGNVFYKASVDASAIKNNGSQYALIENNVFADTPSAFLQREWSNENSSQATRWWLFLYEASTLGDLGVWNRLSSVDFESQIWREHYANTQWDVLWDNVSSAMHDLIWSEEYAKNTEKLNALAKEHAPLKTNVLKNNLAYNIKQGAKFNGAICKMESGGSVQYENNLRLQEQSVFVEYGVNFALREEALTEVRKTIPGFENIPMEKIGPFRND